MLKKVLRGFSVSVILKAGRLVISLVLMSLLARHIGQAGFGHLMVTMALVSVLLCIVELGMQGIIQRDLVHEEGQWVTLGSAFLTRLAVGVVCYAGVLTYAWFAPHEQKLLLVIYGSLLLTHASTAFMGWLLARHHLETGDLPAARAQYTAVLAAAEVDGSALMTMSSDLGRYGHTGLIVTLVGPVYEPAKHGPQAGFNLLRFFLLNPRRVLSKSQILDHVWHYDFGGDANVVETYVSYLRKKLDQHGAPLIHTIRLVGYSLRESEA